MLNYNSYKTNDAKFYGRTIENRRTGQQYELLELLGTGGFACVYKARILGSPMAYVAIKIIDKSLIREKKMESRVVEEVSIHSQLKHPSIVEMLSYFDDANYYYLVLEICVHGTLQSYLQKNHKFPVREPEAQFILAQIVDGLLYMHQNYIMHRDLSLNNLLVMECDCGNFTSHCHVKIADFGLATQLSNSNEKHNTMCGTPNYISREVAAKIPYGLPADVWGLGCMLYTLLVGQAPFETDGIPNTLARVQAADYLMPENLSVEVKDLIRRLLHKDPDCRISLKDIKSHPFMLKGSGLNKYNSTVASTDSGIITISSNASQNQLPRPSPYKSPFINHPPVFQSTPRSQMSDYSSFQQKELSTPRIQPLSGAKSYEIQKENLNVYHESKPRPVSVQDRVIPTTPVLNAPIVEKLDVPPLNTTRLLPINHKSKDVTLSIFDNGDVQVDYSRRRFQFLVSGDGMRIDVTEGSRKFSFNYHSLPAQHIKRYKMAYKFVEMVKAKTAKVTYFSAMAKCQLMETLEDFEAFFYNGIKITKVTLAGGAVQAFDSSGKGISVPAEEYEHFEECRQHCITLESTLAQMQTNSITFPITIGRRPTIPAPLKPFSSCPAISNNTTPLVSTLHGFSTTPQTSKLNSATRLQIVRQIFGITGIPNIGTVTHYSNDTIEVTFNDDNSKLKSIQGGFCFTTQFGRQTSYTINDRNIPRDVWEKFQLFQAAVNYLKQSPVLS